MIIYFWICIKNLGHLCNFKFPPPTILLKTPFQTSLHPEKLLTNIFIYKHNNPAFSVACILHIFVSFTSATWLPPRRMNVNGEENPYCYFHPKEVVVGICALCLKERLLVLASKQGHHPVPKEASHRLHKALHRKPSIPLPKVFALGSFLHRLEFRHQRSDDSDQDTVTSHEGTGIITNIPLVLWSIILVAHFAFLWFTH